MGQVKIFFLKYIQALSSITDRPRWVIVDALAF